jgi:SEC-C motif
MAMAKTARNAACPCGSGGKYKHCCLLEEERLAKQARDDSRVGRSISDWSVEQFGDELAEAFEEFHPESHRIRERDFALLLTWFNSDREVLGGGAPVAATSPAPTSTRTSARSPSGSLPPGSASIACMLPSRVTR